MTRREASSCAVEIAVASLAVLPRRVIFLSNNVVIAIEGSLNGGLRRPSLEIMSFWLEGGTESSESMDSEKSKRVASRGREMV